MPTYTGDHRGPTVDAKLQRTLERKNRRRAQEGENDLREILATPAGRRVVFRLLEESRASLGVLTDDRSVPGSLYAEGPAIYYNAGRQDLGLLLTGWVRAARPAALVEMLSEALADQVARQAEVEAAAIEHAKTNEDPNGDDDRD